MKKIITTLLILCGIYSVSQAQTKNTNEFGFNVGYNASTVSDSQTGETSSYTGGFNLGFSAEHYFSDRWGIKAKVIYDQKGWGDGFITSSATPDGETSGEVFNGIDFHLNYITVPIMANWHFGRMRNWYLNFGPYVGFLLSAHATSNDAAFTSNSGAANSIDVKDSFNSTDFGLALGIGVKFPISNNVKLFIEDDAQAGISHLFKDGSDGNVQSERSSVNIGFIFAVK